MKIIILPLLLLVLLTVQTHQQDTNSYNSKVNFEGDFDSFNHVGPNSPEKHRFSNKDDDEGQGEEEEYAQEEKDMLQFSQHMADFLPDETFTFKLKPSQTEQFFLWPGAEVESIRGMFHSQVVDDSMDGFVSLALFDNGILIRNYKQQRLGIFNIPHNLKDHRYTFKFENSDSKLEVYFSYEFTTKQKRESYAPKNQSEVEKITREFEKVSRLTVQQESEMSRLVAISERHQQRIQNYLRSFVWTMFFQTLLICFGNMASLILLKRQLYAGYELLV